MGRFRPLKYWPAEIMNRLGFPSFVLRKYRRSEVAASLLESRDHWFDKDCMERVKARAPRRSHHSNIERLREAVKFKWQWRKIRYHWRGVGYGFRDCFANAFVGMFSLIVALFGIAFSVPLFIWNWTIWLAIEAVWLTPKQLKKLKQLNRNGDE